MTCIARPFATAERERRRGEFQAWPNATRLLKKKKVEEAGAMWDRSLTRKPTEPFLSQQTPSGISANPRCESTPTHLSDGRTCGCNVMRPTTGSNNTHIHNVGRLRVDDGRRLQCRLVSSRLMTRCAWTWEAQTTGRAQRDEDSCLQSFVHGPSGARPRLRCSGAMGISRLILISFPVESNS